MNFTDISYWITDNLYLAAALAAAVFVSLAGIVYALARFVPRQAVFVLLLNLLIHFLTYLLPRMLPIEYTYHDMTCALDERTPFFAPLSVIYLLAFLQWALYWILLGRESNELRSRYLAGEWISKLLCMLVFIIYPTTLIRPAITGNGIFDRLTALIYLVDAPSNLFPSVHCLMSWLCLRSAFCSGRTPKWYRGISLVFTLLVFLSTVMIKQHVWVDVPSAVLAAEIGLLLAKRTGLDSVIQRLENALSRKA